MKKIFILLMICMLIPFVSSAQDSLGTYKQNENISLLQICGTCTYNNITSIVLPNATKLNIDKEMTKRGMEYTSSFSQTDLVGTYLVSGFGDLDGTANAWAYEFFITPTGYVSNESTRLETTKFGVYALLIIGTILFLGFIFYKSNKQGKNGEFISESSIPIRWSFLLSSLMFYIMSCNIISRAMGDEIINSQLNNFFNFLSAVSFYALWFIGGLLFIIWFLTFLNMWLVRKNKLAFKKLEGIYA